MNLVLIHIGEELPDYIYDTIEQARLFFDGDMYLVKSQSVFVKNDHDLKLINYESLLNHDRVKQFKESNTLQGFWDVTCQRFIILESLMSRYNLDAVFHIENDVTIYNELTSLSEYVTKFKDAVAVNPTGPDVSTGAFIYVDTLDAISFVNEQFIHLLQNKHLILERSSDNFVSEMYMLKMLHDDYPDKVKWFPILPYGEYSDPDIDMLFDPATWGQLLGGIPNGQMIGADQLQHHWIGKEMHPERKFEYVWEDDDKGRRCPFVVDQDGTKYKLNNLHIHCKRIREFM